MESSKVTSEIYENQTTFSETQNSIIDSVLGDSMTMQAAKVEASSSDVQKVCHEEQETKLKMSQPDSHDDFYFCAICREKILLEEIAQVKGCEHSYCVTCILQWASYKADCWCPQCKHPFSFLFLYKALDGSVYDYMSEESVCLLLRAEWFKPVPCEVQETTEEHDDYLYYDDDGEDEDEEYYYTSNLRLGNRRWGDNGYVRAGRREARPVSVRQVQRASESDMAGSSSRPNKGKEVAQKPMGRRAKRALKREAADKSTAAN